MIREHYKLVGVLSPDRVLMVGISDRGVITTDEITISIEAQGTTLEVGSGELEYSIVGNPMFWIEESKGLVKIEDKERGRYAVVGLDYLKRAVEYLKAIEGERGSWKSFLKAVDVYLADEDVNISPVVLAFEEYVSVIAPRIEEG